MPKEFEVLTVDEAYQAAAVAMSDAMRAARKTIDDNSTLDLTPAQLIDLTDDIGRMIVLAQYHAEQMLLLDALRQLSGTRHSGRSEG